MKSAVSQPTHISLTFARRNIAEVMLRVADGEHFIVERRGTAVCVFLPAHEYMAYLERQARRNTPPER